MLETKATLKTIEKLFAKKITIFVFLPGSRPKLKFNFATKKKKKTYNSLTIQIHFLL